MEKKLSFTSSDGSSNIKVEVKEEAEHPYVMGEELNLEEEIASDICRGTRGTQRNVKLGLEGLPRIKEEDIPVEIFTGESINRRVPERFPSPISSQSSMHWIPQAFEVENSIKVEVKEEAVETYVMSDGRYKEEEIPLEISTDGQYRSMNMHSSNENVIDPLQGKSTDYASTSEIDEENMEDFLSVSVDSDREYFEESSDEDEESEGRPSSPERVEDEELKGLLKRLHESVNPPGQPIPPCFQNDPLRRRPCQESETTQSTLIGNTKWCDCGRCRPMPTDHESVCCHKVDKADQFLSTEFCCITMVEEFHKRCLNATILRYFLECDKSTKKRDFEKDRNRCLRRAAFRSYVRMLHGFWGKKKRLPVPSCVVWAIRDAFPDPKGLYTEGYHYPCDLPASDMAMIF
ncbi:uncharacterized protein [Hyperolius riggenbachi]|uniref:uncharacterized protein isoform X4 n=1 Tax=Hyperolius riggenbachi TaxID=752182 RepID=UPI0035A3AFDE